MAANSVITEGADAIEKSEMPQDTTLQAAEKLDLRTALDVL
jgi:hypothetical protein